MPEEVCDLNPQKTCRLVTKLVPRLKPTHQCTIVPQELCQLKFSTPQQVKKPLLTKWCLDDTPPTPGQLYQDDNAVDSLREEDRRSLQALEDPFIGPPVRVIQDSLIDEISKVGSFPPILEFGSPPEDEDNNRNVFPNSVLNSEVVNNNKIDDKVIEDIENFLAQNQDSGEYTDRDTNSEIEVDEFKTFVDETFPRQEFTDFVDFQDF